MVAALLLIASVALGNAGPGSAAQRGRFVAGHDFDLALAKPLSATWEHVDLRTIIRRIEMTERVAIVADRRIDPSRERTFEVEAVTLLEAVGQIVEPGEAVPRAVGRAVYLGPPEAAARLRTLIALRQEELYAETTGVPPVRRSELTAGVPFAWSDFETPQRLMQLIGETYRLRVEGLERLPHDLWAGAVLPEATAIEALSVVLIQFDLTFEWLDAAAAIRIVPAPPRVAVTRPHRLPPGVSLAQAIERLGKELPGVDIEPEQGRLVASATVEEHEAIDRLLRGGETRPRRRAPALKPLDKERYTLRIRNKPARALMNELQKPGMGQLAFEYDEEALKAAGIDLGQRITFEVNKAPIAELLKAAFDPLGLSFELDDRTVRLRPTVRNAECGMRNERATKRRASA